MTPTFFATPAEFRKWLVKHHKTESELYVGFYKVSSKKQSITWSQSVDQALCFGWIDSVLKSIDNESYCLRFTPRKKTSIWSAVNIKKVEALTKAGLMMPAGMNAFELRTENNSKVYAHENELVVLSPAFERQFKRDKNAWGYFCVQAPSYKKLMIHWIMSAKQEQTRLSRLEKTIAASGQQERIELYGKRKKSS